MDLARSDADTLAQLFSQDQAADAELQEAASAAKQAQKKPIRA